MYNQKQDEQTIVRVLFPFSLINLLVLTVASSAEATVVSMLQQLTYILLNPKGVMGEPSAIVRGA